VVRRVWTFTATLVAVIAVPVAAAAHPLGNFTINQYLGVVVGEESVTLDYVVDMAEIPAFQERRIIDANGDESISAEEEGDYLAAVCQDRAGGLAVVTDGSPMTLEVSQRGIEFPPGQAGLTTLRLECAYVAHGPGRRVELTNSNYADRIGWREIVVRGDGVVISTDLPGASISNRLTAYPLDPSTSTPDLRRGDLIIGAAGVVMASPSPAATPARLPVDMLGSLIGRAGTGLGSAALALLAAAALGAGHALAPGHGKTIMAAYLVGNRGTIRQALGLGLAVAVSHTVGVLALGLATLFLSRSFQPETIYPYLSAASGAIVLAIGVALVVRVVRRLRHNHAHRDGHDHHHDHQDLPASFGWKTLAALGMSGGLVPSASAVVLLLGAVSIGQVEFGLALIGAFGVGMAVAMVTVGLGLVLATRFGQRRFGEGVVWRRLSIALPAVMAMVVTGVGAVLLISAGETLLR